MLGQQTFLGFFPPTFPTKNFVKTCLKHVLLRLTLLQIYNYESFSTHGYLTF